MSSWFLFICSDNLICLLLRILYRERMDFARLQDWRLDAGCMYFNFSRATWREFILYLSLLKSGKRLKKIDPIGQSARVIFSLSYNKDHMFLGGFFFLERARLHCLSSSHDRNVSWANCMSSHHSHFIPTVDLAGTTLSKSPVRMGWPNRSNEPRVVYIDTLIEETETHILVRLFLLYVEY